MPFAVGESVNKIADGVANMWPVRSVIDNPIYTALTITFIICLIMLFVFRRVTADESVLTLSLRAGLWVFLALLGAFCIHDNVVRAEVCEKSGSYDEIFTPAYGGFSDAGPAFEDMVVPVTPVTDDLAA